MAWLLNYLGDLESDFSVFHRIGRDDLYAMNGPAAIRLATRIPAYQGAVAARMRIEREEREQQEEGLGEISTAAQIAASPLGEFVSIAQV